MEHEIETIKQDTKENGVVATEARIYALKAAENSAEAVMLLSAAKGVGGFIAKHGPRIIAAVVGIMAYKGFIDTNLASQVAGIFVP